MGAQRCFCMEKVIEKVLENGKVWMQHVGSVREFLVYTMVEQEQIEYALEF